MPELPEVQALAERLDALIAAAPLVAYTLLGFSALKTVRPSLDDLVGTSIEAVERRGKYIVFRFSTGKRLLVHLGQAGRVDVETPPKATRTKGAVIRLQFGTKQETGIFVREYGSERRVGAWVLEKGDAGPIDSLGPEVLESDFTELITNSTDNRRLHAILRDQHFATGIGRGYADDALNAAGLSPFASLRSLDKSQREALIAAINNTLATALDQERTRTGGLSAARLGDRFSVHGRAGKPCPRCGQDLRRVSYAGHEVVYCAQCQTRGKVYADRRLSRLLR